MSEETIEMICITCPVGCSLQVRHDGKHVTEVEGHGCKRGTDYAEKEFSDPRRMVASTVRVRGGVHPLVPVYTSAPIPKRLIFDLLAELREVRLDAPVEVGQVVVLNVLNTGIDVLASRNLPTG